MDDPALDEGEHRRALDSLVLLNRVSRVASAYWPHVVQLARERGNALRVLDVATGAGDVPVELARRAAEAGIRLEVSGCDVSDVALAQAARRAALAGITIHLFRCDAAADPLPTGFDIVTCGLFLHHLDEEPTVAVLRNLASATTGLVLVSDLRRTRMGMALACVAPRVFSRSRVVHVDAMLSVRGAYRVEELAALAERAGLSDARITRVWPQRMLLVWRWT